MFLGKSNTVLTIIETDVIKLDQSEEDEPDRITQRAGLSLCLFLQGFQ